MFRDLAAATGTAAVQGVATFLLRVDGCELAGHGGKHADASVVTAAEGFVGAPAEACRGAVALLAQRGLDRDERTRLAGLVRVALGNTASMDERPAEESSRLARRREAQRALKAWFEEWSSTARAVVPQRGHLIRLGLAKRKSPTPKAPVG